MSEALPPKLARDVAARAPVSLYLSLSAIVLPNIVAVGIVLFLGYLEGWSFAGVALVVAVLGWISVPDRRLDIDTVGLSFVPLVPLRPTQRLPFESLGCFAPKQSRFFDPFGTLRAPIASGHSYRFAGVYPKKFLDLPLAYAPNPREPKLTMSQLASVLEAYRAPQAPRGAETLRGHS